MRTILLALTLALVAADAHAISRYTSTSMSCERVRATIRNEGAAIMRWTGKSGAPLYGRFVRNEAYCAASEQAERAYIPSRDDPSCPVYECKQYEPDDNYWWLRRRR